MFLKTVIPLNSVLVSASTQKYSHQKTVLAKHAPIQLQKGVTLIELILSMVIISIALVGIFSVINLTVSHSADPIVQHQAIAIAEAYLEEIQLQSYTDPNGTNTGESRAIFDNVDDYNGLNDVGARNQKNYAPTNLSNYTVSVAIADQAVSSLVAKKITITVSAPGLTSLALVGYRFND